MDAKYPPQAASDFGVSTELENRYAGTGCTCVDDERQPSGLKEFLQLDYFIQWIDSAFLGRPDNGHHCVYGPFLGETRFECFSEVGNDHLRVLVDGDIDNITGPNAGNR
jgi:hypothetical protein